MTKWSGVLGLFALCIMAASTSLVNEALAQSQCQEAVQGEIAWNEAGTTRWAARNVDRLCEGAEDSVEPARCFDEVMHGGVDWGGGTTWEWENALALCQGTQDSEATVRCFEEKIEGGTGWRSAIDACQEAEEGAGNTGPSIPVDSDVVRDFVGKVNLSGPSGWSAGTGWEPVGGLTDATHIAACEATVFALTPDGRLHQQFSTDGTGEWSLSHRFDQEIQSLLCNRGLLYLDDRRRLFAGTNQLGRPYAAADVVAAEKSGPFPSTYYALNDDRTLWSNRGAPDDEGWRRIGRPADAKRLAAVRGALFALNDDGTLHVTRKPGDSRYWHQLGRIEGAVDITAVYAPEVDGAVLFAVHENGRVYRGEVGGVLTELLGDTTCERGMPDCNVCAADVAAQLDESLGESRDFRKKPWDFDWRQSYPPYDLTPDAVYDARFAKQFGYHVQGFVRTNNPEYRFAVSHSDDQYGSIAFVRQHDDGDKKLSFIHETGSKHPSGLFTLGKYVGAVDGPNNLRLFDTSRLDERHAIEYSMPEVGAESSGLRKGNGGVSMAKLSEDRYLVVVGVEPGSQNVTHFFEVEGDIENPDETRFLGAWAYDQPSSWKGNYAGAENMSLITECGTGHLYLLHTNGDSRLRGDGYWRLSRVLQTPSGPALDVLKVYHMSQNAEDCYLRGAATAYVRGRNDIDLFCHGRAKNPRWKDKRLIGNVVGTGDSFYFRRHRSR